MKVTTSNKLKSFRLPITPCYSSGKTSTNLAAVNREYTLTVGWLMSEVSYHPVLFYIDMNDRSGQVIIS